MRYNMLVKDKNKRYFIKYYETLVFSTIFNFLKRKFWYIIANTAFNFTTFLLLQHPCPSDKIRISTHKGVIYVHQIKYTNTP